MSACFLVDADGNNARYTTDCINAHVNEVNNSKEKKQVKEEENEEENSTDDESESSDVDSNNENVEL